MNVLFFPASFLHLTCIVSTHSSAFLEPILQLHWYLVFTMHTFTLSIVTLFTALLTTRILSTPTSPHTLSPRTGFPGCINSAGDDFTCSCRCEEGFTAAFANASNILGQYWYCTTADNSSSYGPVGCSICAQDSKYLGGELCESEPGCTYDQSRESPSGCFCFQCSPTCTVSAFSRSPVPWLGFSHAFSRSFGD